MGFAHTEDKPPNGSFLNNGQVWMPFIDKGRGADKEEREPAEKDPQEEWHTPFVGEVVRNGDFERVIEMFSDQ